MKNSILGFCMLGGLVLSGFSFAHTCPDPETTSLKWGVPPKPWLVNPFSAHEPQASDNTRFVKANILVAGYGQGVACTYRIAIGTYSIWWPVRTKIPAPIDYRWIDSLGGFVCTLGLSECEFTVAEELN